MRFSIAKVLVEIANINTPASNSHQMNDSPRNQLSKMVAKNMPRATLIKITPINCQRVAAFEGVGVVPATFHESRRNGSGLLGKGLTRNNRVNLIFCLV